MQELFVPVLFAFQCERNPILFSLMYKYMILNKLFLTIVSVLQS